MKSNRVFLSWAMKLAMMLSLFTALQGCTIAYYKTENNLNKSPKNTLSPNCEITYAIEINGEIRQLTTGVRADNKAADKVRQQYIESTSNVFKEHGCKATFVEDPEKSDFVAEIKISPYRSALPQEWCTGLSLGIIPSWGTRPKEYIYRFTNRRNAAYNSYAIDNVSFSHLLLFPVVWIIFFTLDEQGAYEDALSNFIENS